MRIAATITCITLCLLSFAQEYGIDCFLLEDGLPRAHVTALVEDPDNYLLVGTKNGGLARFDGHHFEVLDENLGLSGNHIRCFYTDSLHGKNRVWISTGSKVDVLENGKLTALPFELPDYANALAVDKNGLLLMATPTHGVFTWDGIALKRLPSELEGKQFNDLVLFKDLLHGATDDGLFRLVNQEWKKIRLKLQSQNIIDLEVCREGLLLLTSQEVAMYHAERKRFVLDILNIPVSDKRSNCVFADNKERIWVGTDQGVYKIGALGEVIRFNEWSGLSDSDVRTIYQDQSGAIWFGTAFGGLCKYTSEAFVHYSSRTGLGDNIVSATFRDKDDGIWISTYGGGLTLIKEHVQHRFSTLNGLPSDQVYAICGSDQDFVFAATEKGAIQIKGRSITRIGEPEKCTSIIMDTDKHLWVAGELGWKEYVQSNSEWKLLNTIFQEVGHVSDMDTLREDLYASTETGIYRIDHTDHHIERIVEDGIPEARFTSLTLSTNGDIWAGTEEHGLVRIMKDSAAVYTVKDGLSANQVELVLLDGYENVWVGTRRGIDMVELDVLQEYVLNIDNYTTADGFIGMEVFRNSGMLDQDGSLWFGTTMGATKYDSEKILFDSNEPSTRITDILLNYDQVDLTQWCERVDSLNGLPIGLELPHTKKHVTFGFAGISLAYPERVRYQYVLEGFEEDWSPITEQNRITYPSLPPGDYAFKVIARNASGIWNQNPQVLRFSIKPPIWQNLWFLGAMALLIGLSIYGVVKMRERRYENERVRLESMVDERTKALAKSKQRSEQLLLNILPLPIAQELREHGKAKAREYDDCSVLFSDFKGFTTFSAEMDGDELVGELDRIFRRFDQINDRYNIEKIKTIGDAYMCASGLPDEDPFHALNSVLMGLEMIKAMQEFNDKFRAEQKQEWHIRVGVHTGPLVAGVVGERKFAYDIWGDTVNTASRMEHASEPGRLNISGVTYAQVMDFVDATVRGPWSVKGKGELMMYFVDGLKPEFSDDGYTPNQKLLDLLG